MTFLRTGIDIFGLTFQTRSGLRSQKWSNYAYARETARARAPVLVLLVHLQFCGEVLRLRFKRRAPPHAPPHGVRVENHRGRQALFAFLPMTNYPRIPEPKFLWSVCMKKLNIQVSLEYSKLCILSSGAIHVMGPSSVPINFAG